MDSYFIVLAALLVGAAMGFQIGRYSISRRWRTCASGPSRWGWAGGRPWIRAPVGRSSCSGARTVPDAAIDMLVEKLVGQCTPADKQQVRALFAQTRAQTAAPEEKKP